MMDNSQSIIDQLAAVDPLGAATGVQPSDVPNALPDVASNPGIFTLDYWRAKVMAFQDTINVLDDAYVQLQLAQPLVSDDPQSMAEWQDLSDRFDVQISRARFLTDTINTINSGLNALGISLPQVQNQLGAVQVGLPVIAIGVAAAIALLITNVKVIAADGAFAFSQWQTRLAINNSNLSPDQQAAAIQQMIAAQKSMQDAVDKANKDSLTSTISSGVKTGLLLLAVFLALKIYGDFNRA